MRRVKAICKRCAREARKEISKPILPKNRPIDERELLLLDKKLYCFIPRIRCSFGKGKIFTQCPYILELILHQDERHEHEKSQGNLQTV